MSKRFLTLLLLSYFTFSSAANQGTADIKVKTTEPEKIAEAPKTEAPANSSNNENTTAKNEIKQLNFLENFAANVVVKLSETQKGGDFLLKLVRPAGIQDKTFLTTNNSNYLDMLFNIQKQDSMPDGKISYCGANVIVDYKILKAQEVVEEKQSDELQIGASKFIALENIIIGMHEGETRNAHIPYWYAAHLQELMPSEQEKSSGLQLQVKLLKVTSPELHNVKIFDDSVSLDQVFMCGSKVNVNVKISTLDGTLIFKKDLLDFHLGDPEAPILFAYSLFNKPISTHRTVLAPSSLLKNQKENSPFKFKLPDLNSFILIEFD